MRYGILTLVFAAIFLFLPGATQAALVPLQCSGINAPVTCGTCEFFDLVRNVIEFIIVVASSIAVLIFMYAGFLYLTSGGSMEKAKKANSMFTSVVIGYILILAAFLIVDLIMQTLVSEEFPSILNWNDDIECIYPTVPEKRGFTNSELLFESGAGVAGGSCSVMENGACAQSKLGCFGDTTAASKVCNLESGGGRVKIQSATDLCKDGKSFSGGVFQINVLANHSKIPGCSDDFFEKKGSSAQGDCLLPKTNSKGVEYCAIRDCKITNESKYDQCMKQIYDEKTNLEIACNLYSNGGFTHWQTSAKACSVL